MAIRRAVLLVRRNNKAALLIVLLAVAVIGAFLLTNESNAEVVRKTAPPYIRRTPTPTKPIGVVNARDVEQNLTEIGQRTFDAVELVHLQERIPTDDIKCLSVSIKHQAPVALPEHRPPPYSGLKYRICTSDLVSIFYGHLHSLVLATSSHLDAVWVPACNGLTETLFNITKIREVLLVKYGVELYLSEANEEVTNAVEMGSHILLGKNGNFTPLEGIVNMGCVDGQEMLSSHKTNLKEIEKIFKALINPSDTIQSMVSELSAELGIHDVLYYNSSATSQDVQSFELAVNVQYPTRYRRPMLFATEDAFEPNINFQNFNALSARYLCPNSDLTAPIKQWLVLQLARTTRRFFGDSNSPFSHLVSQVRLASDVLDRGSNYLIKRTSSPSFIVNCCTDRWCLSNHCSDLIQKKLNESLAALRSKHKKNATSTPKRNKKNIP